MKSRGFTLIELLGVVIILAIIMLLVFPSVVNSIKKSNDKIDSATLDLIYNASDTYVQNHLNDFPKQEGNKFIIDINDLIENDLLPSKLNLSDNDDLANSKCVQVTYDDEYKYELKNIGTCEEDILGL